MIEHIEIFEAVVPDGLEPVNRDGEVDRFEALMPAEWSRGCRPMRSRSRPR